MDIEYQLLISSIPVIFSWVPVIFAIINLKQIRNEFIPYFVLVIISSVVETINIISALFGISNLNIFNYYTLIEFTLISLFYILYFRRFFNPLLFIIPIPVFYIVAYFDYRSKTIDRLDSLTLSMEAIVFTIYSLFFFFHLMKNMLTDKLSSYAPFWFNTSVLTYFLGNSLLFIFCAYLFANDQKKFAIIWMIMHNFFNIISYIFLSIGFWKIKKT